MKTNIPTSDEINDLISAAEKLHGREQKKTLASGKLKSLQDDLRRAIGGVLMVSLEPNKPLEDLVELYQANINQGVRRPSSTVANLMAEEREATGEYNILADEIAAELKQLRKTVAEVCHQVREAKHIGYRALVGEIAEKLAPYCDGNTALAAELSSQTTAATAFFTLVRSTDPVIYGKDNLVPPLRAALRALAAKPINATNS